MSGAQLSVTDQRSTSRFPVQLPVIAEHRRLGDVPLHIVNISATGFMVRGDASLGRGERVTVRLPQVGRIEAFLVWQDSERAGFQFERIVRHDDFIKMIKGMPTTIRPRGR